MEINQLLPQVAGTQELTNYSTKLKRTLVGEEKNIIEVKYRSTPFGRMDALEVLNQSMLLLLKINVITGWIIPSEELQNLLVEQLSKKLVEAYPTVNADEVEYAFRNRQLEIRDWGKNFNLTLFDEIMCFYMEQRFEVSKIEQQIKTTSLIEEKKGTTDEEMQEWIDDWKIKIRGVENPMLIPPTFYDWLNKKKIIDLTKDQKWNYVAVQAVVVRHYNLSEQAKFEGEHGAGAAALKKFNAMRDEGCFTGNEVLFLKELAKKIAVFDYLKNASNG